MLVDERTFELVSAAPLVLGDGRARLKHELLTPIVEAATGVCETPEQAVDELATLRREASKRAERHGLRVAAAGSHRFTVHEEQPVTDVPEYAEFVSFAGPAARRQAVCGIHVHVGMPDAETCVRALERALPWLPVVLALSANSPFFRGDETGFASTRAEVLASLPRAGAPPAFASYQEWEATMERWVAAGLVRTYTNAWWDARVHPRFGTLELRVADQPTDVAVTGRLVAILHTIAVRAAEGDLPAAPRVDYESNRFAASRFGPRAELIWNDELVRELGVDDASCEADVQLALRDDLVEVTQDLVARSVA